MKISAIVVSFQRAEAITHFHENRRRAGVEYDELIWVDNGSTDGMAAVCRSTSADVFVLNKHNIGCAQGFNRGFAMATGDWLINPGINCIGPQGWLKAMKEVAATGEVDAVCMYSSDPLTIPERIMGPAKVIGGHRVAPSMAFETCLFKKELLERIGWYREDLGLYGWYDVEWGDRCRFHKVNSVALLDLQKTRAELGPMTIRVNGEEVDYRAWRDAEIADTQKHAVLQVVADQKWPNYKPYK